MFNVTNLQRNDKNIVSQNINLQNTIYIILHHKLFFYKERFHLIIQIQIFHNYYFMIHKFINFTINVNIIRISFTTDHR